MKEWFAHKILGLPELASSNGQAVDDLMVYVHWLMLALFVGWIIYFGYVLWRFSAARNPKADHEGSKSPIPKYTELAVVVIEAVLLHWHRRAALGEERAAIFPSPRTPPSFRLSRSNSPGTRAIPARTANSARKP